MAKVNEAFNVDLPLRALFLNPSIEALAEVIINASSKKAAHIENSYRAGSHSHHTAFQLTDGGGKSEEIIGQPFQSLFPMQPRGNRPCLFIVSGVHADEDGFYRYLSCIIPSLGLDQPLYGLRPRGLLSGEKPHKSIEEMAADYIREIKVIQPQGPYYIGGECIGGLAAYEIVRQLEDNNDEIAILLLLDTFHVSAMRNTQASLSRLQDTSARRLRRLVSLCIENNMNPVKIIQVYWARKNAGDHPGSEANKKLRHVRDIEQHYGRILKKYRPRKIRSKISLIANEEDYALEKELGWLTLYGVNKPTISDEGAANNFSSTIVKGNHLTRLTIYGWNTGSVIRNEINSALAARNAPDRKTGASEKK
jgi:thioesterase domain-containing protein